MQALGFVALALFHSADGVIEVALVNIADRGNPDIRLLQQFVKTVQPLVSYPNAASHNLIVGPFTGQRVPAGDRKCCTDPHGPEERPSRQLCCFQFEDLVFSIRNARSAQAATLFACTFCCASLSSLAVRSA
jgi:hypothetical protein